MQNQMRGREWMSVRVVCVHGGAGSEHGATRHVSCEGCLFQGGGDTGWGCSGVVDALDVSGKLCVEDPFNVFSYSHSGG